MKCANCSSDALYEYKLTNKTSIFYCGKDLPRFLYSRRDAGHLATTDSYATQRSSALEALSDVPVVVEVEKPTPTVVKKTAKKIAE
jgi:hypothetical protein